MPRRTVLAAAALAALAAFAAAAPGARAGEGPPPGPVFGNGTIEGEIRDDPGPDEDDLAAPLVAGERLTVSLAAAKGSALLPSLRLLDPDGEDRTPPLLHALPGRVSLLGFAVPRSGWWTVRVSGTEGTQGAWRARFSVGRSPDASFKRRLDPGAAPRVEEVPFEAVGGCVLDLRLDAAVETPPLAGILDPSGDPLPGGLLLLERRGRAWVLPSLPLPSGEGTWRLLVAVGEVPVRLSARVAPPDRPRGTLLLDPREPRLAERAAPLEIPPGAVLRLAGSGFSTDPPPRVFVGGLEAEVREVGAAGDRIDVLPPPLPAGTPLPVAVANPDGQACFAADHVLVLLPGSPVVSRFLAESLTLPAGGRATVTVILAGHAPPGGAEVLLEEEGGVLSIPASVRVEPWGLEAAFEVAAGEEPGPGLLRAILGGAVVLPVTVTEPPPPASLDLSGWRLVQTSAARTFTLPAGTVVPRNGALVVARKAARAEFEAFWGEPLPAGTSFVDTGDRFPSLNGDETLALEDPSGTVVDGPTIPLSVGRFYRRIPGTPAGAAGSWLDGAATPASVVPGGEPPGASGPAGVHIAQYADPPATGQFVFEFVEIRWDGN